MVKRRKFMIGAGSLIAGSAAAVGTGAVTDSSSARGLKGRVASDKNAYIALEPNDGGAGHHAQFVEYDSKGELTLNFDVIGEGGNGLNPDSVMSFRSAFTITNQNNAGNNLQVYDVWIESPNPRLSFFTNGGSITGEQNAVTIDEDNPNYPDSVPVGVKIDLEGSGLGQGDDLSSLFDDDDEFVIKVKRKVV
jgi:hypothetical protein